MALAVSFTTWVIAVMVVFALTYLYKITIIFRIAEYTLIGCAMGHGLVMALKSLQDSAVTPLVGGDALLIIPLIIGVLMFGRVVPGYQWLSRWPTAVLLGVGSGLTLRTTIIAQLLNQIKPTIKPIATGVGGTALFSSIVLIVGVLCVLWYFVFTVEKTGIKGNLTTIGRWFMMVTFGANYAQALMGRITYMVNAIYFLLSDWLGLIK